RRATALAHGAPDPPAAAAGLVLHRPRSGPGRGRGHGPRPDRAGEARRRAGRRPPPRPAGGRAAGPVVAHRRLGPGQCVRPAIRHARGDVADAGRADLPAPSRPVGAGGDGREPGWSGFGAARRLPHHAREVQASDFTPERLAYLFRHEWEPRRDPGPLPAQVEAVLASIRRGLADAFSETSRPAEVTGETLRQKLALLLDPALLDTALEI